jgi:hypothetical protein
MSLKHVILSKRSAVFLLGLAGVVAGGCKLDQILNPVVDPLQNAVATLDDAISKISATSGSWQNVLQDTVGKLTSDAQSTVRNEVQTLLQNSVAAVQVGAMCTIDFIGHRVVQSLERIKASLLGQSPPPLSPFVCGSAPLAVEFDAWQQSRVPIVTLTGYDLKVPLGVRLVETTGTTDVPNVLASISTYQVTINLGATGLHLTPKSQRIVVLTAEPTPVELSAINVVQPQPKICVEKDVDNVVPQTISFLPSSHTRGDSEFDGSGPRVTAQVSIYPVGSHLNYRVSMTAAETESDWTTVTGSGAGELTLSKPVPANFRIAAVNGPTVSNASYVDQNHNEDHVRPTNGGPVSEFRFLGDTSGDDVGRTRMTAAVFNSIGLHLVEIQNCVTRAEARSLLSSDPSLTPSMTSHLKSLTPP